ncbi:MAG: NUDIX domain-containing protein [Lachnospiraceae bacterium]|nr:NUDIX domain-containing protein [Lachnospiraceae bacterium]
MINEAIDGGRAFDWGRVSGEYAKYRDIYPELFYEKIVGRGLCTEGQKVLDLGTGTGVLPRNMYRFGAEWVGTDISVNQIEQAERLSAEQNMDIRYQAVAAEDVDFPPHFFDVITACQCFWYFDHERLVPKLSSILKENGSLLLLYMAWLPFEDAIAGASEELALKYNPDWTGAGEWKHRIEVPDCVYDRFEEVYHEEYTMELPFTRETWHGRMKACRGIGASLAQKELEQWESEHKKMLSEMPENFFIKHYAAMLELKPKARKTVKVTAAIIRNQNRIFATQRGYGEFKDGWEFPGGKVEPGETSKTALIREIKEELDTEIAVGEKIMCVEYDYPAFHLSMDCFWAKVVSGNLTLKEHEDARWLSKEELDDVAWLPADLDLIERIKKMWQ